MATYAIGDVHANLPALADLLSKLKPDVARGDVVVFLGDFIDRGKNARRCIDAFLEFDAEVNAEVLGLCGNHEDWMLRTMGRLSKRNARETIVAVKAGQTRG